MAQGHVVSTDVRHELVARRALRSKMAEIRDADFATLKDSFHDKTFAVTGLRGQRKKNGSFGNACRVTVEDSSVPGLLTVTVTMSWDMSGRERTVSHVYLLTKIRE